MDRAEKSSDYSKRQQDVRFQPKASLEPLSSPENNNISGDTKESSDVPRKSEPATVRAEPVSPIHALVLE